jgi:hypothetical protein
MLVTARLFAKKYLCFLASVIVEECSASRDESVRDVFRLWKWNRAARGIAVRLVPVHVLSAIPFPHLLSFQTREPVSEVLKIYA